MVGAISETRSVQSQSLDELLLSYLARALPGRMPGCDGLTTQQMLREYPKFAVQGVVPGCEQLERWHPGFKSQLARFFHKTGGVDAPRTAD